MLASWVAPAGIDQFRRDILRRSACALAQSADSAIELLTWDVLGEVLGSRDPASDVIVCAKGHLLPFPPPRDLEELRGYMRLGIGLAMRHTERRHPRLRALADDFAGVLGGSAHVQVFVTPGGTHGLGWHYDAEDVFIAQTAGVKDYYFRENTVEADMPFPPRDFDGYHREKSPIQTACLAPGDFLYIPARWWHMALCREDSLSISVGVMTASS